MKPRQDGQRGAVILLVAIWLPVLVLFASFAVDAAHWWDYSRNLQNRADAAAFAGGDQLAVCLGSPSATSERGIGEIAQQYAGPPSNTPDSLANVPYTTAQLTADGFTPYYNVPNLTSGAGPEGPNYHLLLNSSQYWPTTAQNGVNGYGDLGSYCTAMMVDARITQANVPMFFNLLGFHPNITAHARVELQTVGTSGEASPISVGDAGQAGCVVARVVDETNQNAGPNSDGVLARWSLNEVGTSTTWTAPMPSNLSIPSSSGTPDMLGLQAVLPADCSNPFGAGSVWDAPSTGPNAGYGLAFINTYKPLNPPVSAPTRGSVWLEGGTCTTSPPPSGSNNDPYFYRFKTQELTCPVNVRAQVDFPAPPSGATYHVSISEDGGAYVDMPANGTDGSGNTLWAKSFNISPQSGRHTFALSWYLANGSGACKTAANGSNNNCQFDGGRTVQATFSAFDDGTGIDDSGPVIAAGVGCDATSVCPTINGTPTSGATSGVDSLPGSGVGSSPKLTATFTLQGLQASGATDKPTVLRSSVQSSGRTGIFDCGQGLSGSAFQNVMLGGGCGTYVTPNGTKTSGLEQYSGALNTWTSCVELPNDPISCGQPVTGNMRGPVHDAIATLICGDAKCQNTPAGRACDYWQPYKAGTGPLPNDINDPGDPRAIELVITSPQDLALAPNDPRWIRVLGFATFYITGWDGDPYLSGSGTTIPGCGSVGGTATNFDEPYPYGTTPNNAVWGHLIAYVFPGQGGNGKKCVANEPFACTPTLTR